MRCCAISSPIRGRGPTPCAARPTCCACRSACICCPRWSARRGGFRAAELALLAQNAALLTALLTLASTLFDRTRTRAIALATFLAFSGMDVVGTLLFGSGRLDVHLEWWNVVQYSSTITQAFWVPQHGMAGWTGALLYLLWRDGRLGAAGALLPLPLLALWSPLALVGAMPFAAHIGVATLVRRKLTRADVLLPAAATLAAVPALLYLAAGSGAVGGRGLVLPLVPYELFIALEVAVFLLATMTIGRLGRFGGITALLVTALLLAAPYVQIGNSADFAMRASIPALAILAVQMADLLARRDGGTELRVWQVVLVAALLIGAVTPLSELYRALARPTSPSPRCSYFGIVPKGDPTYLAPLATLSPLIAPTHPALVRPADPPRCWDKPWPRG